MWVRERKKNERTNERFGEYFLTEDTDGWLGGLLMPTHYSQSTTSTVLIKGIWRKKELNIQTSWLRGRERSKQHTQKRIAAAFTVQNRVCSLTYTQPFSPTSDTLAKFAISLWPLPLCQQPPLLYMCVCIASTLCVLVVSLQYTVQIKWRATTSDERTNSLNEEWKAADQWSQAKGCMCVSMKSGNSSRSVTSIHLLHLIRTRCYFVPTRNRLTTTDHRPHMHTSHREHTHRESVSFSSQVRV